MIKRLAQWWVLGSLIGGFCGLLCAAFLLGLEFADTWRAKHPATVMALPLAGGLMGLLFSRLDENFQRGNRWITRALREPGVFLSIWLIPTAFLSTLCGHLFGASVGQEGTAVQMGATSAELVARSFKLDEQRRHEMLVAGVAGAFGAAFGTPIAGAIFALEFRQPGKINTRVWLPALIAACAGNFVTTYLGSRRMSFPTVEAIPLDAWLAVRWLVVGSSAAALATVFVVGLGAFKQLASYLIPLLPLRMATGGAIIAVVAILCSGEAFLGGGLPLIQRAFDEPALPRMMWVGKATLTIMSLGSGYMGGEVTPLFVMGACLGNALASLLSISLPICVGVSMVAVFGAASKTPVAMSVMAVEGMGLGVWPHAAVTAGLSVYLSGRSSIYPSVRPPMKQRIQETKASLQTIARQASLRSDD